MKLSIIILAAGRGKRMYSAMPKVLHPLGGVPMLERVVRTASTLKPQSIHVVYGNGGALVRERLGHLDVHWVEQTKLLGTGHAVLQAMKDIPDNHRVLILYGDVPLVPTETLTCLLQDTPKGGLGLVCTELEDPTGFGRIIHNELGNIVAIVEEKDADEQQRAIRQINTGILTVPAEFLKTYLPRLNKGNAQGEYYLTDIIALAVADGYPVGGIFAHCSEEVFGANDRQQLANLERFYQRRAAQRLMEQGVALLDPTRFDLRGEAEIAQDVVLDVDVILEGKVSIGAHCEIGPYTRLRDTTLGKNVTVRSHCDIEGAIIDDGCVVGPFARIRPGTHVKTGAHVGNFVEVKNSEIGENSKASHLTYLGDAVIGKDVNVGAGTITCNYDGAEKHKTVVEDNAFIGSGTELIAPVRVGRNATIGAGSTITQDVPADRLALTRDKQRCVDGWERPIKKKHGEVKKCAE